MTLLTEMASAPVVHSNDVSLNKKEEEDREDLIINGTIEAVSAIYTTYFELLAEVTKQLAEDLKGRSSTFKKQKRVTEHINALYTAFFGFTEYLETKGVDNLAKLIVSGTTREEVREETYNSIADELREDALGSFLALRDDLQETLETLGLEHEAINVSQAAASGALTGGALGYLSTRGKAGGKGAVAGALIGAGLSLAEKAKLRRQIYGQGLQACSQLLKGLFKLSNTLFDQTILYCLPKRPIHNPKYEAFMKYLETDLKERFINHGILVISFIELVTSQLEAKSNVNGGKWAFVIILTGALGVIWWSYACGAITCCWVVGILFAWALISILIPIFKNTKLANTLGETIKQFEFYSNSWVKKSEP
jgi:hypothetical protein